MVKAKRKEDTQTTFVSNLEFPAPEGSANQKQVLELVFAVRPRSWRVASRLRGGVTWGPIKKHDEPRRRLWKGPRRTVNKDRTPQQQHTKTSTGGGIFGRLRVAVEPLQNHAVCPLAVFLPGTALLARGY